MQLAPLAAPTFALPGRWPAAFGIAVGYIALNSFLISQEVYWGLAIPFGLAVLYFTAFGMDKALLLVAALAPFSVQLDDSLGVSFFLPTEPLMFGIMCVFFIKLLVERRYPTAIAYHPMTVALLAMLAWMCFTTLSSSMPGTSAKFVVMRLWSVVCFYFLGALVFRDRKGIKGFFVLTTLPTLGTIAYALQRHAAAGFTLASSTDVLEPFYVNHGQYAAVLAMLLPVAVAGMLQPRLFGWAPLARVLAGLVVGVLVVGLVLSYTRAAWLGVGGAVGLLGLLLLRVRFRYVFAGLVLMGALGLGYQQQIRDRLRENKTDSATDFGKHLESVTNIRTDASNLERINRWESGLRMFAERPLMGWGPGTYMFQYAPFQKPWEKTYISTNLHTVGGIHSEYIGPLVEQGILGALLWLAYVLLTVRTGMNLYYHARERWVRWLAATLLLGLVTYYVHGVMNNYLDLDKTSIMFWAYGGMLVALAARERRTEAASEHPRGQHALPPAPATPLPALA